MSFVVKHGLTTGRHAGIEFADVVLLCGIVRLSDTTLQRSKLRHTTQPVGQLVDTLLQVVEVNLERRQRGAVRRKPRPLRQLAPAALAPAWTRRGVALHHADRLTCPDSKARVMRRVVIHHQCGDAVVVSHRGSIDLSHVLGEEATVEAAAVEVHRRQSIAADTHGGVHLARVLHRHIGFRQFAGVAPLTHIATVLTVNRLEVGLINKEEDAPLVDREP